MKRYQPFKFNEAIDSVQDFNTTSKNMELRTQYREFPSSGYFTSVSGRVIKIIKGVE